MLHEFPNFLLKKIIFNNRNKILCNIAYEYTNYWILLSNKGNILLPILKIKRSSYHIFTQNKRKIHIRHGYWIQSTLYECSLKVLYNLGFQSSITKRNKARVLPLVYAMSTSTKNRHACLLLDQIKLGKRL